MFRRSCFTSIRRLEAFVKGGASRSDKSSLENEEEETFESDILYTIIANPNTLEVSYEFP